MTAGGLMFLHMKDGLDADIVRLKFSQESYEMRRTPLSPLGVRKDFQIELPLSTLFESPTAAGLAAAIAETRLREKEAEEIERLAGSKEHLLGTVITVARA